jgi:adenylate cyclase
LDYTVIGDMVNVASRLCSIAQGDQIIIGRTTYGETKDRVECRSAGTPDLKGKTEAVEVFEVLRLTD